LHVESGNGQVPAPSFSRHLGPSGLGDAPAQTGGHDAVLKSSSLFVLKTKRRVCESQATSTPFLLQNFVAKMSFFSEAQKNARRDL
jgi:hypothetical protein